MNDFEFTCPSCKQVLEGSAELLGTAVNCPACNTLIQLPKPGTASPPAATETEQTPPASTECPQCQAPMDADAVICTSCGYDTRTGRKLEMASPRAAAPVRPSRPDAPAPRAVFPVARILVGLGVLGGLAAAVVYFMSHSGGGTSPSPNPRSFQLPSLAKAREAVALLGNLAGEVMIESDKVNMSPFTNDVKDLHALRETIIRHGLDGLVAAAEAPVTTGACVKIAAAMDQPRPMTEIVSILGPEQSQVQAQQSPAWRMTIDRTTLVLEKMDSPAYATRTTWTDKHVGSSGGPEVKVPVNPLTWFQYGWIEFGAKDGVCKAIRMQCGRPPPKDNFPAKQDTAQR